MEQKSPGRSARARPLRSLGVEVKVSSPVATWIGDPRKCQPRLSTPVGEAVFRSPHVRASRRFVRFYSKGTEMQTLILPQHFLLGWRPLPQLASKALSYSRPTSATLCAYSVSLAPPGSLSNEALLVISPLCTHFRRWISQLVSHAHTRTSSAHTRTHTLGLCLSQRRQSTKSPSGRSQPRQKKG